MQIIFCVSVLIIIESLCLSFFNVVITDRQIINKLLRASENIISELIFDICKISVISFSTDVVQTVKSKDTKRNT